MNNMWNMQKILDPDSCRITNQERKGRFSLENNALQHGIKKRTDVCEEVNKLKGLTEDLVAKVKSDIEVLDEGHGNAIRVFTLVTLFFLPLSVNISAQYAVIRALIAQFTNGSYSTGLSFPAFFWHEHG
jgi:hypothetical protein